MLFITVRVATGVYGYIFADLCLNLSLELVSCLNQIIYIRATDIIREFVNTLPLRMFHFYEILSL